MHIITGFMNDDYYPLPQFEEGDDVTASESMKDIKLNIDIDKSYEPYSLGSLPKIECKLLENIDLNNLPEEI
jgi:hypothetical protein